VVVATDEIIVADVAYNFLLKEVQKQKDAKLIFLLRDDGMAAYNKALGWAQATYALTPERTGKLPLPGRGEIDLKQFKQSSARSRRHRKRSSCLRRRPQTRNAQSLTTHGQTQPW